MDPSSILERAKLVGCAGACIAAGVPSTTLVPLPLTLAVTRRFGREDLLKRMHFMVGWAGFCRKRIFGIELSRVGGENLPRSTRGHMFVSNHQSWIDILVLMESLNTVAFLSKDMIKYIPVIGTCAYAGGTIFFDRKAKDSRLQALRQTLRMCERSTAVVVFPEGTRSFDGELRQKIHPGAIKAAYERGLKVIPVGLDGTCKVLPKSMDRINRGRPVAVTIGEAIDPARFRDVDMWVQGVWGRVTELFHDSRGRLPRS
jgi:1-acyl-sn-glycerol-3-phosphate acyltransferase